MCISHAWQNVFHIIQVLYLYNSRNNFKRQKNKTLEWSVDNCSSGITETAVLLHKRKDMFFCKYSNFVYQAGWSDLISNGFPIGFVLCFRFPGSVRISNETIFVTISAQMCITLLSSHSFSQRIHRLKAMRLPSHAMCHISPSCTRANLGCMREGRTTDLSLTNLNCKSGRN